MAPVVFVVTLGSGNAYAAPPVNITVFGQASITVSHRSSPPQAVEKTTLFSHVQGDSLCPLI
jgi:hypothetical protein